MNKITILLGIVISLCNSSLFAQTEKDSVTISGIVTDFNGQPEDSVSVMFKHANFRDVQVALTNKDGFYKARLPKGKYKSVATVNLNHYIHTAPSNMAEKDVRLEFWGWNFIADRDTTLNMNYNRMEAYGMNVFNIQGAAPYYTIYVRPFSLTRFQNWMKNKTPEMLMAPASDKLKVTAYINDEEVTVRFKQEIKEYVSVNEYFNAFLLTVDMPTKKSGLPYTVFKIVLTDLENGDKGEGIYYLEKENYL